MQSKLKINILKSRLEKIKLEKYIVANNGTIGCHQLINIVI